MNRYRGIGLILALGVLAGCATPRAEILNQTATYPPTMQVEVLLDTPARPHKTFALLQDTNGGSATAINARLAEKGREIGADAVVITGINDKTTTEWIMTDPYYPSPHRLASPRYRPVRYTYRTVRAKAIKYTR